MRSLNDQAADDRGQVGIGTLIVFIAMVLVAAIAAGVLINTAGFLQSSSQATGQGASDATSNRLQVVSVTGLDLDGSAVGVVDIIVKHGPGANDVDLETTTVQWIGPSGSFYQLAAGGANGNPDGRFTVETVQDDDGSNPVLNDREDRLKLRLELGSDETLGMEGELATDGPYRYSRNPQYVGLFAATFGAIVLAWSTLVAVLGGLRLVTWLVLPFPEETWLRSVYGAEYEGYCEEVPRFVGYRSVERLLSVVSGTRGEPDD